MDMLDSLLWWTLKGTAIALLALAATALLRRRPAAVRHAVWSVAVIGQLLVPLSGTVPLAGSVAVSVPLRLETVAAPPSQPVRSPVFSGAATPQQRFDAPRLAGGLLVLMAAGALLLLLRLIVGTLRIVRITRRAARVVDGAWLETVQRSCETLGIRRPVTLVWCDRLHVPVTWGVVHPVILLPEAAREWPEEVRRHVLLHELAHVKRVDALTQLAAQLAAALFWFNPFVWVAVRRMRAEAENACDDYVLRAGERPAVYATTLFELVRAHDGAEVPALASLSVARPSELEQRVRAITDPGRDVASRRALSAFAIVAALVIVLPLSAVQRASQKGRRFEGRMFETAAQSRASCQPAVMTGMGFGEASGTMTRDGKTVAYFFLRPEADRCIESSFSLNARFTDDDRDLVPVPGLEALVREKRGGTDRVVSIGASNGALVRRYTVDGQPVLWDGAAERWYRTLLPEVVRLTQAGIEPRARRILEDEGVAGLVAEVGRIPANTGVRREYLQVLLALRTADELPREQAIGYARAALEYEPDLAQFLAALARREGASEGVLASVLRATAELEDIADRNAVLGALAGHEAAAVRLAALDALALLPGDVWRRTFLAGAAHAYLDTGNAFLVDAFFAAADGIRHGREKRELLDGLARETWPPLVQRRIALATAELR
jgi:beta-lactamase regulating signal transducer with metallopeptidase domain